MSDSLQRNPVHRHPGVVGPGTPAYHAADVACAIHVPVETVLKILIVFNWVAFGLGALMTLLYGAVCVMMLPYPQLVANAGGGLTETLHRTAALGAFTLVAALAAGWLERRYRLWWIGQGLLLLALAAIVGFVLSQR